MKRRNADCGKLRRPVKRTKISEGVYGSTFLYMKFLLLWALMLLADFIVEFRFEYLWPFWLLLRSVYDSFKYQGLAFSIFFVFIAVTSDMICYLFIPVHWLFFAASTYVWVQYVWHTDRGVCLPTVSLWLLFVYIEASVRLKELKNMPFHVDLCRPFAAHCIGYPVVTLGFGFKSYVGYRLRLRKQKEVCKENEFYMQLLQQALPNESSNSTTTNPPDKATIKVSEEIVANGVAVHEKLSNNDSSGRNLVMALQNVLFNNPSLSEFSLQDVKKHVSCHTIDKPEYEYIESHVMPRSTSINDYDENEENYKRDKTSFKTNNCIAICQTPSSKGSGKCNSLKDNVQHSNSGKRGKNNSKDITVNNNLNQKDDHMSRLEADIKRLSADLQTSQQCEQELRVQIHSLVMGERSVKNELAQLQRDNENLQNKLHNLVTARQQDKHTIGQLEKKLQEEKKARNLLDNQLNAERKNKKEASMITVRSGECTENCKMRQREIETDIKQLRRELKLCEEKLQQTERETELLRKYKDSHGETEVLMSALCAMQDKNVHLETSLSAETRLKLDLFSALGEVKRQLEIAQVLLMQRDKEIDELKSKIAEVMAVMPVTASPTYSSSESSLVSSVLSENNFERHFFIQS